MIVKANNVCTSRLFAVPQRDIWRYFLIQLSWNDQVGQNIRCYRSINQVQNISIEADDHNVGVKEIRTIYSQMERRSEGFKYVRTNEKH